MAPGGDAARAEQATTQKGDSEQGVTWTPAGRVVYASRAGGNWDLWSLDPSNGEKRQMTNTPASETRPCATADGRYVVYSVGSQGGVRWAPDGRSVLYVEAKAGVSNVWARPLDGSPPKRLTDFKSEEFFDFDISRNDDLVFSRGTVLSDAVIIKHVS